MIMPSMVVVEAQAIDASTKPAAEATNRLRMPQARIRKPDSGIMTTSASR